MKPVSLLTQSLRNDNDGYRHAIHQLQQLNAPSVHTEQIRNITLSYQARPSRMHDGKDWARQILENPGKHHTIAVKWARQVLLNERKQTGAHSET